MPLARSPINLGRDAAARVHGTPINLSRWPERLATRHLPRLVQAGIGSASPIGAPGMGNVDGIRCSRSVLADGVAVDSSLWAVFNQRR